MSMFVCSGAGLFICLRFYIWKRSYSKKQAQKIDKKAGEPPKKTSRIQGELREEHRWNNRQNQWGKDTIPDFNSSVATNSFQWITFRRLDWQCCQSLPQMICLPPTSAFFLTCIFEVLCKFKIPGCLSLDCLSPSIHKTWKERVTEFLISSDSIGGTLSSSKTHITCVFS